MDFQVIQQILWILGSAFILILGAIHLIYTLYTNKLYPRRGNLVHEMKRSFPNLTTRTTMWKAWLGFNCSHSAGAMFFGALNMYLAIVHFWFLQSDLFIPGIDLLMSLYYCWLGWKYWFRTPMIGIISMTISYLLATALSFIK